MTEGTAEGILDGVTEDTVEGILDGVTEGTSEGILDGGIAVGLMVGRDVDDVIEQILALLSGTV